ncbi:MAG: hypothetical protein Q7U57_04510 [Methylovulum sp.]|nr:hypothetical protein [Methylovulum sp.]
MITISLDDDLEALLNNMADKAHTKPEQLVKDLIKRYAETITASESDFFDCAGIWQDRDIDQETIRAGAWREEQR